VLTGFLSQRVSPVYRFLDTSPYKLNSSIGVREIIIIIIIINTPLTGEDFYLYAILTENF
jgi:hypothetical protein